ncbi:MAG: tetratricopeptide repeat protein [Alcanivoracaceae bacterium]
MTFNLLRVRRSATIVLLLCAVSLAQASPVSLIAEARQHLAQGEAQPAYDLLAQREADYAGDPDFDYWLGLAAVRAGKPARAVFALERVIIDQPGHAGARLELAAAYLQLGQREAAAEELDIVSRLDAPAQARERIAALSRELERQDRREGQNRRGGYVGLELGHDDNVGTWPQGLELFPGATVDAIDSAYLAVRAGGWYRMTPAADQKLVFSLNGQLRSNHADDAEQFDQAFLAGRGEWSRDLDGRNELAGLFDLASLQRDGDNYYTLWGLGGELRRRQSDARRLVFGAQLRQILFEQDSFDHLASRVSARLHQRLSARWNAIFDLNLDYEAAANNRPGGDAVLAGLRASTQYQLKPRHRLGGEIGYGYATYRSDYQPGEAINNLSAESRDDHRLSASVSWDWFPAPRLQLRGQALYRDQSSSLDAFTYDQTVVSAGLNYYF